MFVRYARAFIIFPRRLRHPRRALREPHPDPDPRIQLFPTILVDSAHWAPLLDWIDEDLDDTSLISPPDIELLAITKRGWRTRCAADERFSGEMRI